MVSSKPYPRNLLMAFKIFNSHFDVQNCRFRALFFLFTGNQAEIQKNTTDSMLTTPWACYFPKITFLAFPQIKLFIKTSKNHPVSAHSTRLLTPEAKIKKKQNRFTEIQTIFWILTKSKNLILVSLKKSEGLVFNRG
jgi:hypothetical protein